MSVQTPPRLVNVTDGGHDRPDRERALQPALRLLRADPAGAGAGAERLDADVVGADRLEVRGEFAAGRGGLVARAGDIGVLPVGRLERDVPQVGERELLDQILEQPQRHRRRGGTPAGARPAVAGVDRDLRRGAAHHVAAPGAPGESGEQRGPAAGAARRAGDGDLRGLPLVDRDDRRVRGRVDVLADLQLAEVDAVREELPHPARGHAEPLRDLDHRHSAGPLRERPTHLAGALVGREFPRLLVAPVPGRRLAALPDPQAGRSLAPVLEAVDVLFPLPDRVREVDVPHEPAVRRARVQALRGAVHVPAGGLHAVPDLEAGPGPREPRQVRHDDPLVAAGLHALDRGEQRRTLMDRLPAADRQLRGHELDVRAELGGVALHRRDLFLVGVEPVTAPPADEAHPYNRRPQRSHDVEPY